MYRRWICFCLVLLLCYDAFSQVNSSIPISTLLHTKQHVTINWHDNTLPFTDTPYNRFPQELLKTKDGLFLFVNGSGRLYQLLDKDTGIGWQRIDSTFYSGYNFGSYPFVYHDSIFTLGGYGIWRINGQLRVYVPQAHSWDIVPLNEEIPVMMQENNHDMLWYNEQSAKLYIAYSIVRNEAVKHSTLNESAFDYTVRVLDLKTKDWQVVGALNDYFKDKIAMLRNIAFTPWGQLVTLGDKLLIIDYTNNRLLRIQEAAEHAIRPILFQNPNTNLYYCIDSTLYFGNIAQNKLDSIQLHSYNFTDAGIAVYTAPTSPTLVFMEWIGGVAVFVLTGAIIWHKKKQSTTKQPDLLQNNNEAVATDTEAIIPESDDDPPTVQPTKPTIHFDERELQVIQLILSNNQQSLPTTIDELNAVLGLSKKSNDAQKNYRSMVLKSINTKYSIWQNTSDKLIESKKAETDKRSFTYSIAPDKEAAVAKLLKNASA